MKDFYFLTFFFYKIHYLIIAHGDKIEAKNFNIKSIDMISADLITLYARLLNVINFILYNS